ncbi:hypothetical protein [Mariniflexile sp. HMF6888]
MQPIIYQSFKEAKRIKVFVPYEMVVYTKTIETITSPLDTLLKSNILHT